MSEEQQTASEQGPEPTVEEEQQTLDKVLGKFAGAPNSEQIELWKTQHGECFVSGFSETDLYVWRPLTRPEYRKLQEAAQNPENQIDQFRYEEMVCESCVLWRADARPWSQGKAGTCGTLHEQIMQNSNFMPPAAAAVLVQKL